MKGVLFNFKLRAAMIIRKTMENLIKNPLDEKQINDLHNQIKNNIAFGKMLLTPLYMTVIITFLLFYFIFSFSLKELNIQNILILSFLSSFFVGITGLLQISRMKTINFPLKFIVDNKEIDFVFKEDFQQVNIDENSLNSYSKEMYKNIKKQNRNPYGFEVEFMKELNLRDIKKQEA